MFWLTFYLTFPSLTHSLTHSASWTVKVRVDQQKLKKTTTTATSSSSFYFHLNLNILIFWQTLTGFHSIDKYVWQCVYELLLMLLVFFFILSLCGWKFRYAYYVCMVCILYIFMLRKFFFLSINERVCNCFRP